MQYFNQDDQTLTVCLSALPQYSRDFHKPCVIGSRKYAKKGFEKSQKFRSKIWSLNDKIYALWESQLKKNFHAPGLFEMDILCICIY